MTSPVRYNILLITEFSKPWHNGWYYKAGLEKNGHTVVPFDPETVEGTKGKVFEIVREIKPDFILHTKDELPAETFEELRQFTKVVMWYPDPVIPAWLVPYVKACDIFLTMSEGLIQDFKKYNEKVFYLSQAFEPSFFQVKEITGEDKRIFSSDVAFAGNLGSKGQYLSRRAALEKVIDAGFKFRWWGPKIPRKFSTIPLLLGKLGRAYGGRFVWGEEYAKVARLSRIFLAFDSMPHIRKSMSARMYTAVGCGAFYMCRHVDGIEDVLAPGREIVTFRSEDEMIDMIRYYLENDELRMNIAEAGKRRVLSDHTYEVRARQMCEMMKTSS
ncbi:MAG: glycosyltransferase [Nitrospirae bacterium]|nr:glycosyltransferase [Nitrospirota bacterium]